MPPSFISAAGRPIVEGQWPLATAYVSAMLQPTTLQSFVAYATPQSRVKTQELMMEGEGCTDHAARPVGHSRAVRAATCRHTRCRIFLFGPHSTPGSPVRQLGWLHRYLFCVADSPCFLEISPTTSHTRFVVPFPS